jgi:tungstate transport system ATP-binding protein
MTATAESIFPLELSDLRYEASDKRLINDLSFTLEAGPRTIILGPNGAGKSLLLRLCHGLIQPSGGAVRWHGARARNPSDFQAMVFQRPIMLRRSAQANVDYALALKGVSRSERKHLTHEVLEKTGLAEFARRPARVMSFGEQQKLALARAWVLKPQVLFLDEPTASLDPGATYAFEEIIAEIHAAGTKIIMTTHNMGQARRLADEVLFIHQGRLLEQSPADEFFAAPKNPLAEAFIRGDLLWGPNQEMPS